MAPLRGFLLLPFAVTAVMATPPFDRPQFSTGDAVVMFFHPKCRHCTELAPRYAEVARQFPTLSFDSVDCSEPTVREICQHHRVVSFPTINYYRFGEMMDSLVGGARPTTAIAKWIRNSRNCPFHSIGSATELQDVVAEARGRTFVIVHDSDEQPMPVSFRTVAAEYCSSHPFVAVSKVAWAEFIANRPEYVDSSDVDSSDGPRSSVFCVDEQSLEMLPSSFLERKGSIRSFVEDVRFGTVAHFGMELFFEVKASSRPVVVLVSDSKSEEHKANLTAFTTAAKLSTRLVYFGWMDAQGEFEKPLKAYGAVPGTVVAFAAGEAQTMFDDARLNMTDIDAGIELLLRNELNAREPPERRGFAITRLARNVGRRVLPFVEKAIGSTFTELSPTTFLVTLVVIVFVWWALRTIKFTF